MVFYINQLIIFLQLGREEPAMSMDNAGKIIFAKHSEILQANLKNLGGISDDPLFWYNDINSLDYWRGH